MSQNVWQLLQALSQRNAALEMLLVAAAFFFNMSNSRWYAFIALWWTLEPWPIRER